jgi:AcrR family transcriptional regulator
MATSSKRLARGATTRLPGAERKRQIVEVILELVSKHGVEGVTISRIAARAGVTQAALYMHFASREEMLRAAVDVLYERVAEVIASSNEPDVMLRLRSIGGFHSGLVSSGTSSFIHPLFEFLAAPPETGLREMLGAKQRQIIECLAAIVEEGKAQGSIRTDVDAQQVAWELHGVYWAEDVSHLMGLTEFVTSGRSTVMLDRLLTSIAADGPLVG